MARHNRDDFSKEEIMGKFGLLKNLGTVTVPSDYSHPTALATFAEESRQQRWRYNDVINDVNFQNPSRILEAGDVLHVSAWQQIVEGYTMSYERMDFLRSLNAVFTGAQGAALVFVQKRTLLPKGRRYLSFDEPDRLWRDVDGHSCVPAVDLDSCGSFSFRVADFVYEWWDNDVLLCFRDQAL